MQKRTLRAFQKKLEERKEHITRHLETLYNELNQLSQCDLNDEGDVVSVSNSILVENVIDSRLREELYAINRALSKIKSSSYGTCEMCGVEIGVNRLQIKPHAKYCIDCREIVDKE